MVDAPCSLCARPEADHDDAACSFGWTPALPPLRVWTARASWRGEGRLDITRKSGTAGLFLAPSWAILRPALDVRVQAMARRSVAVEEAKRGDHPAAQALFDESIRVEVEAWARYVPLYVAEMRVSYRANVEAWKELLARREVTLCCYCAAWPGSAELHCHRRLLAALLVKCGAVDMGER